MSLENYFKQLLAEKHAERFTIVQDNASSAVARDVVSAPLTAQASDDVRRSKERPTLAKSVLNADPVAPKLPQRQKSHEGLLDVISVHVGSPKLPQRKQSGDKLLQFQPVIERNHFQNAMFGSPRTARRRANPSVFASFYEDTRGLLSQLPRRVDLIR